MMYMGGGSFCPGCHAIEHICNICEEVGNWAETLGTEVWLEAHRLARKEVHWVLGRCYDGNDCYYVVGE